MGLPLPQMMKAGKATYLFPYTLADKAQNYDLISCLGFLTLLQHPSAWSVDSHWTGQKPIWVLQNLHGERELCIVMRSKATWKCMTLYGLSINPKVCRIQNLFLSAKRHSKCNIMLQDKLLELTMASDKDWRLLFKTQHHLLHYEPS